jgi:hypothetical protein
MKKTLIILAVCGMVASFATSANAQVNGVESIYFFDIRDNVTTTPTALAGQLITSPKRPWTIGDGEAQLGFAAPINAGGRGGAQVLRLSPTQANGLQNNSAYGGVAPNYAWPDYDQDGLLSTGNLWLYGVVEANEDTIAGVNDVVSSLGINLDVAVLQTVLRNPISAISFQLFNSGVTGVPSGSPWNNKIDGAVVAGNPPQWAGAKAARVPVNTGPVYQQNLGLVPGAGAGPGILYRLGSLRVTAGVRNCAGTATTDTHAKKSSYSVKIRNNNILTTRVYQSGGDAPGAELVAYGYTAAASAGELANASGSVENATSATADAIVQIRTKGDFDGNGVVDTNDTPLFLAGIGLGVNVSVKDAYAGDFTHDRIIDANDVPGYLAALGLAASCP